MKSFSFKALVLCTFCSKNWETLRVRSHQPTADTRRPTEPTPSCRNQITQHNYWTVEQKYWRIHYAMQCSIPTLLQFLFYFFSQKKERAPSLYTTLVCRECRQPSTSISLKHNHFQALQFLLFKSTFRVTTPLPSTSYDDDVAAAH